MGNKQLEWVKKAILKQGIYDNCVYLGIWNECEVYSPSFSDGEFRAIGLLEFIIVKDEKLNFISNQKTVFEIMDYFSSESVKEI